MSFLINSSLENLVSLKGNLKRAKEILRKVYQNAHALRSQHSIVRASAHNIGNRSNSSKINLDI